MQQKLKHFLIYLATSFFLATLLGGVYIFAPKVLDTIDSQLRDYMFLYRGEIEPSSDIVIIDLDNYSLQEIGQWPWSRDIVSDMLVNLTNAGVGIIGLDIVFAEADRTSPHLLVDLYGLDKDLPNYDEMLAWTIANTPTIAGYQFELEKENVVETAFPNSQALVMQRGLDESNNRHIKAYGTILNIEMITQSAYSSGFFNNTPDDSGIIRSVPLIIEYEDMLYPSLGLEIVRLIANEHRIDVHYDEIGIDTVAVGEVSIPTDMFGRLLVNYRGGARSYEYISAADIVYNRFDPADIEGKVVLVGTSAAGLLDLRATPFEAVFPGVEVHANVIDNLLMGDFITQPSWADGVNIVHIFALIFFTVFAVAYLPTLLVPFALLGVIGLDLYLLYYLLFSSGVVLNIAMPLASIVFAVLVVVVINSFFVENVSKVIKRKFASKVSPAVMEDILSHEDDVLSGKDREVTVFFSDLRNFTNISEALHDPRVLIELLNEYMTPMSDIIVKNGGTIDKYIGDAIMAYFNAPTPLQNHQDKAVIASLQQLYAVKDLNEKVENDKRFQALVTSFQQKQIANYIDIGIGLNTGVAIVGEMGSQGRSDYTVIGDPVNLGARLESLCKFYGSKLNISNLTKQGLKGDYIYRYLDLVTVKGKSEPVEIWQVVDYDRDSTQKLYKTSKKKLFEEIEKHHEGIKLYKQSKFSQALKVFEELERDEDKTNDKIYKLYIDRCKHYISEPPKDFNGVFVHTTKG